MTLRGRPAPQLIIPPGSNPALTPPGQPVRSAILAPPAILQTQPVDLVGKPGIGPGFSLESHVHAVSPAVIALAKKTSPGSLTSGLAVRDDGTSFVLTASDSGLNLTTMTLEGWIQSSFAGSQVLVSYGQKPGPDPPAVGLFVNTVSIGDGVDQFTASVLDGNWHHLVLAFDGVNITAYVDGVSIGSSPVTKNIILTGTMYVGAWVDAANRFFLHGAVDEVAIYSGALSAARIAAHYAARNDGTYTSKVLADNPLRYYQFEETAGPTAFDASGHANGTYSGGGLTFSVPGAVKKVALTASPGAADGVGAPPPVVSGTDNSGSIAFGTGAGAGAGILLNVTFSSPGARNPVVSAGNAATAALQLYVANVSSTGFSVGAASAPASSQPLGTFAVSYVAQ